MPRKPRAAIEEFGLRWEHEDPLQRVFYCIQHGGQWQVGGVTVGAPLFDLYKRAESLLWPDEDHHRWTDAMLRAILESRVTCVLGPKSSGKTHGAAKWALVDYWCFPDTTTILITSTDLRGLELRVWGDLKSLIQTARQEFKWLPGKALESKHAVATDQLDEDSDIRDLRNGIICVPCLSSTGRYVGMSKFVGVKNKRVRLVGDEVPFVNASYLDVPSNLDSNPDFKAVLLGNPLDPTDTLGRAAEPIEGWTSIGEPKATCTWRTKFLNGIALNLVGTDSPNFDPPFDPAKPRYPYLIHAGSIASTVAFYGKDSQQYWTQCAGIMKTGVLTKRVITRQLCQYFHAFDDLVWEGSDSHTKIYACDVAYGNVGGDRCVGGWIEFGRRVDGVLSLWVNPPRVIPVPVGKESPEHIIAKEIKQECERQGIPPENVFYDATGRGSMGTAFAIQWSNKVNPVEFGGNATPRPVFNEMYIWDQDKRIRRLKRCDEEYTTFVTELWYSVRHAIEGDQMRHLPEDVALEGCQREWGNARGNKKQLEAKEDMKLRTGRSPDLFDWLATAVEGARQRGFTIAKLANSDYQAKNDQWLDKLIDRSRKLSRAGAMTYS